MSIIKPAHLYNIKIPRPIRKSFCLLNRISDFKYDYQFKQDYVMLDFLHNKFTGKKCFVVGMGPSLDKTNFKNIRSNIFITSNNFYEGKKKFKINPLFNVVADDTVLRKYYCNLIDNNNITFLTEDASRNFLKYETIYRVMRPKKSHMDLILVRPLGNMDTFMKLSKDLRKGAYGGMVIWSSLQVAYHLGFKEVYLLGCDCTFKKGEHFVNAQTFNKSVDDWEPIFKKYEIAKRMFELNGRKIYNATVGGDLEIFERRKI